MIGINYLQEKNTMYMRPNFSLQRNKPYKLRFDFDFEMEKTHT